MLLPTDSSVIGRWYLWDYQERVIQTQPAAANGVMLATFPQVPSNELWFLTRALVQSTSALRTECRLYDSTVTPLNQLEGTLSGNFDVADMSSPLQLSATTQLLFNWTGATPGAVAIARAQWTVLRQTTPA